MGARLGAGAFTLVLVSLLTSCGVPVARPAASEGRRPLDACALLEAQDAEPDGASGLVRVRALIELTVGRDAAKCSYGTPEPPILVVSLEVRRLPSVAAAGEQQRGSESMLPRLSGVEVESVDGVGDRAVWAGCRIDQLHVLAGELRLIVTVEVGQESGRRDHATRIAVKALERLALEGDRASPRAP